MLETLTKEDWETCLQKDFTIRFDVDSSIVVTLITVSGFGRRLSGQREAYSLVFQGAGEPYLTQRIYRMSRPQWGELDIFLVPIARTTVGIQYEAVFT